MGGRPCAWECETAWQKEGKPRELPHPGASREEPGLDFHPVRVPNSQAVKILSAIRGHHRDNVDRACLSPISTPPQVQERPVPRPLCSRNSAARWSTLLPHVSRTAATFTLQHVCCSLLPKKLKPRQLQVSASLCLPGAGLQLRHHVRPFPRNPGA